jgi:hypothetical protein
MHSSTVCGWQTDGGCPCNQCCSPSVGNGHVGKSVCASLKISSPKPSVECLAPQPQAASCFCSSFSSAQLGALTFGPLRMDSRRKHFRRMFSRRADSRRLVNSSHSIKSCLCKLNLVLSCAIFSSSCCSKSLFSSSTITCGLQISHCAIHAGVQTVLSVHIYMNACHQAGAIDMCTRSGIYQESKGSYSWYKEQLQASCKQQSGQANQVVCL